MSNKGIKLKNAEGDSLYPCPYFPVGSIYMSVNSTNPSTYFGGTWVQIQGRFLIGVGTATDINGDTRTLAANQTGGEFSHKLTESEMPEHNHKGLYYLDSSKKITLNSGAENGYNLDFNNTPASYSDIYTGKTGGNQAHNNIPPYLAVYIWKRTA